MRLLITAGGTREYIDPVRFISNASSGKMGYALVRAALRASHKVTLITTVNRQAGLVNRAASRERRATVIRVQTAAETFDAVRKHFPRCDCLIMAAAVADYTPAKPAKTKIKKAAKSLTIKLKPTADILKWAGEHKTKAQILVGFALEDKELRRRAEEKMQQKNLDMIIANTPAAIAADKAIFHLKVGDCRWVKLGPTTKAAAAMRVIRAIEQIRL